MSTSSDQTQEYPGNSPVPPGAGVPSTAIPETLADNRLLAPPSDSAATSPQVVALPQPNLPRLEGYDLLGELGRGGMGVVYKARYKALDRVVALKMILAGGHASATDLARFKAEALSVSRLQHANIVQIFDSGEQDGRPFFSLEYCSGGSLETKLRGRPQAPTEAAALIRTLALAVQAAHDQGIIHRDLKPANVLLVRKSDARPKSTAPDDFRIPDFEPKITDFGLAKKFDETGSSGQTASGTIMGTPSYMAPEQAEGKVHEIGPAADVYALGAVLYELMTGRPPFRADTAMNTLMLVIHDEPVPPRSLQPRLPVDLETICLKCLEKSAPRRYASAKELADDLGRFLNDEPIQARPVGALGRLVKWAKRRPSVAALSALVLLVTVVGFALVSWKWLAADLAQRLEAEQRQKAEKLATDESAARLLAQEQQTRAERMSARLAFQRGLALCEEGPVQVPAGLIWLAHSLELAERSGAAELEPVIRSNLAGWSALVHPLRLRLNHPMFIHGIALTPDGKTVATGCNDGIIRLWNTRTGKETVVLRQKSPILSTTLSPDGKTLLAGAGDGKVWFIDIATHKHILHALHQGSVRAAAFSGDGKLAATGDGKGKVQVWNAADKTALFALTLSGDIRLVRLSKDGRILAVALVQGAVEIYDTATRGLLTRIQHGKFVEAMALNADGTLLLTGGRDFSARLWDAARGTQRARFVHTGTVYSVAFHPIDQQTVLTGSWDRTAQQWTFPRGEPSSDPIAPIPEGTARGPAFRHDGYVMSAQYSPDAKTVATASTDGTVRLWDAGNGRPIGTPLRHQGAATAVAFSADCQTVVTRSADWTVRVWDVVRPPAPTPVFEHVDKVTGLAFRNERTVYSSSWDRRVRQWTQKDGQWTATATFTHPIRVIAFALDAAGKHLVTGTGIADQSKGSVWLWDVANPTKGREITQPGTVLTVAMSRDGTRFVTGYGQGFNRDGRSGAVQVWDNATPPVKIREIPHPGIVWSVAFRPDGKAILTGCATESAGGLAQTWDAETGDGPILSIEHRSTVQSVAFSPDGKRIVTGTQDGTVQMWDATSGAPIGPPMQHSASARACFSPDGRTVLTGSLDETARVWDAASGLPLGPPVRSSSLINAVTFRTDGKAFLYGTFSGRGGLVTLPTPITGKADEVMLQMRLRTGLELPDNSAGVVVMTATAYDEVRKRVHELEATKP